MPKKNSPLIKKLEKVAPIEFVSSGIPEIDELTNGYPRARVTQVYGLSSVGKTSLMVKCMAEVSKKEKILYIDVENAINVDRFIAQGADPKRIDYASASVLEDVCELIRENIAKYDLIVLDSVAMLVPRAEHEGETGEQFVGLKPRLLGQWLRQIEGDLANTKCALILINQMRRSMEMYGEKYVLPGGMQLKFSSSLMLQLVSNSVDKIVKERIQVGHWVHAKVTKSKVSTPFVETKFKITY